MQVRQAKQKKAKSCFFTVNVSWPPPASKQALHFKKPFITIIIYLWKEFELAGQAVREQQECKCAKRNKRKQNHVFSLSL
jgi:hypothetical protein